VAGWTWLLGHVPLDALAHPLGVGLLVAALEVVDDALEADGVGAPSPESIAVGHLVALVAGAVEEDLALRVAQLRPGLGDVDPVGLRDGLDDAPPVARVAEPPWL